MSEHETNTPLLAVLGATVVMGNVLGVVFLRHVPHAYRIEQLEAWTEETMAHAPAHSASALFFIVGVLAMPFFLFGAARHLGSRHRRTSLGAGLVGLGAGLNAIGCLLVVLRLSNSGDAPSVASTLQLAQYLDAAFNLLLGVGLALFSLEPGLPRGLRIFGLIAAALSIPVAGQAFSDQAARLLAVSGPAWLLWFTAATVVVLRTPTGRGGGVP